MSITATELKDNLNRYLSLAGSEDIFISKNGNTIAKLSNPNQDRINAARSLFGVLPSDVTPESARKERLSRV